MPPKTSDVVAIGNAIVDIIGRCDDAFLARHGATKGAMQLVEPAAIRKLYDAMGPAVEISGGSAANTMVGIASLGGRAAFIGKVADDEFGRIFTHDIKASGVAFTTPATKGAAPTSRSLILVTPDGERTMNTYLGISTELDSNAVDAAVIAGSRIVYLEGYLFDRPQSKAAFREAAAIAAKSGVRVALTLSDGFCVARYRAEFLEFIKSSVDIVFANESEVTALYETKSFDAAAARIAADVDFAALTRGSHGALILTDGKSLAVPAEPVAKVVDTTGAGDLFAAGVLHGLARGLDPMACGRLGVLAAAEIIGHIGARPEAKLADLAKAKGLAH